MNNKNFPIVLGAGAGAAVLFLLLNKKEAKAQPAPPGGGGGGGGPPQPSPTEIDWEVEQERANTEYQRHQSAVRRDLEYLDQVLASVQGSSDPPALRHAAATLREYNWETQEGQAEAYNTADYLDAQANQIEDELMAQQQGGY